MTHYFHVRSTGDGINAPKTFQRRLSPSMTVLVRGCIGAMVSNLAQNEALTGGRRWLRHNLHNHLRQSWEGRGASTSIRGVERPLNSLASAALCWKGCVGMLHCTGELEKVWPS